MSNTEERKKIHQEIQNEIMEVMKKASMISSEELSRKEMIKLISETVLQVLPYEEVLEEPDDPDGLTKFVTPNGYELLLNRLTRDTGYTAACNHENMEIRFICQVLADDMIFLAGELGTTVTHSLAYVRILQTAAHEWRHTSRINKAIRKEDGPIVYSWGDDPYVHWLADRCEIDADAYALAVLWDWLEEQS